MSKNSISWGKLKFNDSQWLLALSENHSIHIQKDKMNATITNSFGDTVIVNKYITGNKLHFFIEPCLPELPIILNPLYRLSILPSEKLEAYIEIPFTVRILYGSQHKKNILCEIVQKKLSKSFFGSSESGEFAYFIDSPLHHNISDYQNISKNIYCPLSISNKSSQNLEFEKMIFRAPYLSIYQQKDQLVAGPVNITFKGHEQANQITYKKSPDGEEEEIKLLTHPRMAEDKNLLKKSFYFIKNLYTG